MLDEVAPVARVHRSRLAVAVAITLAALPLLVIDNLPATAEAGESHVEASAAPSSEAPPSTTTTPTTAARVSTSTTLAPTTTAAPTTTVAPTTSVEVAAATALRAAAPPAPVAPTTTRPPTTTTPPAPAIAGDPNDPATWDKLAQCESGGNWAMSSGNGYYGGLQFSLGTWQNVGGTGYPHQASKAEQVNRGKILQARAGWGQWPHCARQLGYL